MCDRFLIDLIDPGSYAKRAAAGCQTAPADDPGHTLERKKRPGTGPGRKCTVCRSEIQIAAAVFAGAERPPVSSSSISSIVRPLVSIAINAKAIAPSTYHAAKYAKPGTRASIVTPGFT